MYYLYLGTRSPRNNSWSYEVRGMYTSLSDAVWNFFDFKKSMTMRTCNRLYNDTEIHLSTENPIAFGDDNGIIFSAYNDLDNKLVVQDNLKGYLDYFEGD